jgi:YD repeat-containing protein
MLTGESSYVLDNAGNRTSKQNLMNGVTEGYSFDAIYELMGVQQGGNTTESYTYDKVGNRLSSITSAVNQYNSSNELTSDASFTYQYDNNGNLTSKTDANAATTRYTWDFENRLSSVVLPGTEPSASSTTHSDDVFRRTMYQERQSIPTMVRALPMSTM